MADFSALAVLIVLITIGFIARKCKLLKDEHINAIPALLFNIVYPALILISVNSVNINQLAYESIVIVVATIIITITIYFTSLTILKNYKKYDNKPLLVFNLAIGNITFVMLPIVKVIFGDIGVYYAILHGAAQDILIWTLFYKYFKSDGGRSKISLKNIISPCSITLVISLVSLLLGIKFRGVFADTLRSLSALTSPLALIYIGGILAGSKQLERWRLDREIVIGSITKIVIIPLIVYCIMILFPISNSLRILIAFLFSAPSTIMSTVWAKEFNYDYVFSIKYLFFSTLLFLVAMTLFFYLKII